METTEEEKRVKCLHCGAYPELVTECLDGDMVYKALECDCPKRTSFMRGYSCVGEWESSTYKLTKDEAEKVQGVHPSHIDFRT